MEIKNLFKKRKSSIIGFSILAFVACFITLCAGQFYMTIRNDQIKSSDDKLASLSASNISSINLFFEGQKSILSSLALTIQSFDDVTSKEAMSFLSEAAQKLGYVRLAVDSIDGIAHTSDGHIFDITGMGTLDKIKEGKPFVADVKTALADGESVISIHSPIFKEGKLIGALRSVIKTSDVAQQIVTDFSNGIGYFHIIDGEGNYVANSDLRNALLMDENFFDAMQQLKYETPYSYNKFMRDVKIHKQGFTKYAFDGEGRYAHYASVGINDWIIMTIVPKDVVESLINKSLAIPITLLIEIFLTLLIIFAYIFWKQKRTNQKMALDDKCFRVLSEQTGNIIFEWNFINGTITSMSNFENIFGRIPFTRIDENDALTENVIHPADIGEFSKIFHEIKSGRNIKDIKFRIKDANGDFVWCSISGIIVNDSKGKPYKAIGSMRNIDSEEKEAENLRNRAQKDLLTDLYNRVSTESLVNEYIIENCNTEYMGAMLMIDIDNFKGVNDNLGHQFGDKVLIDTADKLKSIFRTSDVIGRIGGDEFAVFMRDISNSTIVKDRAKMVCTEFSQVFYGEKTQYRVSASVGIALYPEHGFTFSELYKHSDIALYETKRNGKNSFSFYSNDIATDIMQDLKPIEDAQRFIASHFSGDPIHNVFEMLYETKDIYATINMILHIIGIRFNVDRCYIFEKSDDKTLLSNTYEWCAPNISPEIDTLQNIPIEQMSSFFSNYNDDGIFYCNDLAALDDFSYETLSRQGIKSLLHCAIFEGGTIKGFIGFDECKRQRIWSGEEIATLGYISQILSIFIVKSQISHELMESYHNYTQMLDNMPGYIYVVNPQTFETLYINNAIKAFGAHAGEKCHKIAFFEDSPCENCPIRKLTEEISFASSEIYSVRAKTWVNAVASNLKWAGSDAVLVFCTDITRYKEENGGDISAKN